MEVDESIELPGSASDPQRYVWKMNDNKRVDDYLQLTGIAPRMRPDGLKVGHCQFLNALGTIAVLNRCFERVCDEIKHSYDYQLSPFGNSCSG